MALTRLKEGESYRFIKNYYGGCGYGSSRPIFSKGDIIVANRTQSPDSDGDVRIEGNYVHISYLEAV